MNTKKANRVSSLDIPSVVPLCVSGVSLEAAGLACTLSPRSLSSPLTSLLSLFVSYCWSLHSCVCVFFFFFCD